MERLSMSMSTGELISTERLQYNNIDLIKFIMAFAVVAIHTNPLVDCKNDIVQIVYNNIVNMAVPFFFLTTGFFTFRENVIFEQSIRYIYIRTLYRKNTENVFYLDGIIYPVNNLSCF